jgi:hypothetical protein
LGRKGTEFRDLNKKMIEKEIRVGMIVAKECEYLISYSEIFDWEDYFCIKMEYCSAGDIKKQIIDSHRVFTQDVYYTLITNFYFILFCFRRLYNLYMK